MPIVFNLEQFFKGYLHYGCSYKETSNEKVMQKFTLTKDSIPDAPSYQCILGPSGCHVDNDCSYKDAFWCACAGKSCLRYKEVELNSGTVKTEVYAFKEKSPGWGWQGCKLSGLSCWCTEPSSTWRVSWTGDNDDSLRDIHHMLSQRRSRVEALKKDCEIP